MLRPIICITKRQQQTTTIINKPLYNIHELEEDIMKWLHYYYYYYAFSTINKILAVNDGHSFSANKCHLIISLVFFFSSNITNIVMLSLVQLGFFCVSIYIRSKSENASPLAIEYNNNNNTERRRKSRKVESFFRCDCYFV